MFGFVILPTTCSSRCARCLNTRQYRCRMQGQERSNEHGEVHLTQELRTEPDARPSGLKWVGWSGVRLGGVGWSVVWEGGGGGGCGERRRRGKGRGGRKWKEGREEEEEERCMGKKEGVKGGGRGRRRKGEGKEGRREGEEWRMWWYGRDHSHMGKWWWFILPRLLPPTHIPSPPPGRGQTRYIDKMGFCRATCH